jgi:hypothetical protein
MKSIVQSLCLAAVALGLGSLPAVAQTTTSPYAGNGATGFGGPIGGASLAISNNSAGLITFTLTCAGAGFGTNDVAFYFDSVAGGYSSTSTFTDNADSGRSTLSGLGATGSTNPGPSVVTFASGFTADYGVALDGAGNGNLFLLGTGSFTFVSGTNYAINSNVYTFSLNASALGLTVANGSTFKFVANELNANDSSNGGIYRSNESIGTNSAGAANPAQGPLTFTAYDSYTLSGVPEPSTNVAMFVGGAVVLGGFLIRRRRLA